MASCHTLDTVLVERVCRDLQPPRLLAVGQPDSEGFRDLSARRTALDQVAASPRAILVDRRPDLVRFPLVRCRPLANELALAEKAEVIRCGLQDDVLPFPPGGGDPGGDLDRNLPLISLADTL